MDLEVGQLLAVEALRLEFEQLLRMAPRTCWLKDRVNPNEETEEVQTTCSVPEFEGPAAFSSERNMAAAASKT